MADRSVRVNLSANATAFINGMRQATSAVEKLARQAETAKGHFTGLDTEAGRLSASIRTLGTSGGPGMANLVRELRAISTAVRNIGTSGVADLAHLATSIHGLSTSSGAGLTNLARDVRGISSALRSLDRSGTAGLTAVTPALTALGHIGSAGMTTAAADIRKIASAVRSLSTMGGSVATINEIAAALARLGHAGGNIGNLGGITAQLRHLQDQINALRREAGHGGGSGGGGLLGNLLPSGGIGQLASYAAGVLSVGAAVKSTVSAGIDYQNNLNTLQAVTRATQAQMAAVSDTAIKLGNDITLPGTSAADAASAMTALAKGGLSVEQSMKAASGTLRLAAASGTDAATAADIQVNALNAFRLSAGDAAKVADQLANVANASTGEITDFALGMQQSAAVSHTFGLSLKDNLTALGLFANAGLKGADAGTSLKSMLQAIASPSKQQAAAMKELGLKTFDAQHHFVGMRSITEQLSAAKKRMSQQDFLSAASTAFGSDAVRAASIVAEDGTKQWDDMSKAVGRTGGASEVAAAKSKGLGGAIEALKNQAETAQLVLFNKLAPAAEALVRGFSNAIPQIQTAIGSAFKGAGDFFQPLVTGVKDLAVRVWPYIKSFSESVGRGFQSIVNFVKPVVTAIGTFFTTISKNGTVDAFGKVLAGLGTAFQSVMKFLAPVGQAIGTAIGFIGGMGAPVTAAVTAFGLLLLLKGPLTAMFVSVAQKAALMTYSLGTAGIAGAASRAIGGISRFAGFLGGPWGLALGVGVAALVTWISRISDGDQTVKDMAKDVDSLTGSLDQHTAAITNDTRATVADNLVKSGTAQRARELGLNLADLNGAALGNATSMKNLNDQITAAGLATIKASDGYKAIKGDLDAAGISAQEMAAAVASGDFDAVEAKWKAYGQTLSGNAAAATRVQGEQSTLNQVMQDGRDKADKYGQVLAEVGAEHGALGVSIQSVKDKQAQLVQQTVQTYGQINFAVRTTGEIVGKNADDMITSFTKVATASGKLHSIDQPIKVLGDRLQALIVAARTADFKQMTGALKQVDIRAQAADLSLQYFTMTVDKMNGVTISAARVQKLLDDQVRAIKDGFKAATDATKGHIEGLVKADGTINTVSDAGSKLFDVVSSYREAYDTATSSAVSNAKWNATVADKVKLARVAADDARGKFLAQADAMHISRDVAEKMADAMGILEGKKITPKTLGLKAQDEASAKIDGLKRKIDGLRDKSVTIEVKTTGVGQNTTTTAFTTDKAGHVQKAVFKAAGGSVWGSGAKGVDSVPAVLAPGEHVLTAGDVDAMGGQSKVYAFRNALHMATGGAVGAIQGVSDKLNGLSGKNINLTVQTAAPDADAMGTAIGQFVQSATSVATAAGVAAAKAAAAAVAGGGVGGIDGALLGSQNPSSFGWQVAGNIQPYAYNGTPISGGVAGGTQPLWTQLFNEIVPTIKGGLVGSQWGFENRDNVNSPGNKSFHAYGLAVDLNAPYNGNKTSAGTGMYQVPPGSGATARRLGFLWGGEWQDPMHFELHRAKSSGVGSGSTDSRAIANEPMGAGVERWRSLAASVAAVKGENIASVQVMLNQMSRESSGNPRAINLTDSNAQAGHPSKGLLQFIDSTFQSYADPGFSSDIWDPASQMHAWYNYINARYGGYEKFATRGYGAYAKGGAVDTVPAMLAPGEHVLTTGDVSAMGGQSAVYGFRNALHLAKGGAVPALTARPLGPDAPLPSRSDLAGMIPPNLTERVAAVTQGLAGFVEVLKAAWQQFSDAAGVVRDRTKDLTGAQHDHRVALEKLQKEETKAGSGSAAVEARIAKRAAQRKMAADKQDAADQRSLSGAQSDAAKKSAQQRIKDHETARQAQAVADAKLAADERKASGSKNSQRIKDLEQAVKATAAQVRAAQKQVTIAKLTEDSAHRHAQALSDTQVAERKAFERQKALAARWDGLSVKIAAAQDKATQMRADRASTASSVAGTVAGFDGGLTGHADTRTTFATLFKGQLYDLAQQQKFVGQLAALRKLGLNSAALGDIASKGAEGGGVAAGALLQGGKAGIANVNLLQSKMKAISEKGGDIVGDAMYANGIRAADGFVKGLQSQQKAIGETMGRVAAGIDGKFRKALKIHSPSQVFASHGENIINGLARGIVGGQRAVDMAMSKIHVNVPGSHLISSVPGGAFGGARPTIVGSGPDSVRVYMGDRQITDLVRVEINDNNLALERSFAKRGAQR